MIRILENYRDSEAIVELTYGRSIIKEFIRNYIKKKDTKEKLNILDLGAGQGKDLINIKMILEQNGGEYSLYAIEEWEPYCKILHKEGIDTKQIDIEREALPFKNQSIDIVVVNQVLEHTKEIFWIMSEVSRILKVGGRCIIGVPNLACFHNRFLLLFGKQPLNMKILGPHVRGFTKCNFIKWIETENFYRVLNFKGSGFYPFGKFFSNLLCNIFPNLGVSIFFEIERTDKLGTFIQVLEHNFFETNFYKGRN